MYYFVSVILKLYTISVSSLFSIGHIVQFLFVELQKKPCPKPSTCARLESAPLCSRQLYKIKTNHAILKPYILVLGNLGLVLMWRVGHIYMMMMQGWMGGLNWVAIRLKISFNFSL